MSIGTVQYFSRKIRKISMTPLRMLLWCVNVRGNEGFQFINTRFASTPVSESLRAVCHLPGYKYTSLVDAKCRRAAKILQYLKDIIIVSSSLSVIPCKAAIHVGERVAIYVFLYCIPATRPSLLPLQYAIRYH